VSPDAPTALIFAPHPDDEVIVGGLPLRLLRELQINVINVAVTLGSRADRRANAGRSLRTAAITSGSAWCRPQKEGWKE
jgi:LmbE family N-acetylglucosaminyl deacetylase